MVGEGDEGGGGEVGEDEDADGLGGDGGEGVGADTVEVRASVSAVTGIATTIYQISIRPKIPYQSRTDGYLGL